MRWMRALYRGLSNKQENKRKRNGQSRSYNVMHHHHLWAMAMKIEDSSDIITQTRGIKIVLDLFGENKIFFLFVYYCLQFICSYGQFSMDLHNALLPSWSENKFAFHFKRLHSNFVHNICFIFDSIFQIWFVWIVIWVKHV